MTLKESLLLQCELQEIQSQGCSVGCVAIGTVTKVTSAFRFVGKYQKIEKLMSKHLALMPYIV